MKARLWRDLQITIKCQKGEKILIDYSLKPPICSFPNLQSSFSQVHPLLVTLFIPAQMFLLRGHLLSSPKISPPFLFAMFFFTALNHSAYIMYLFPYFPLLHYNAVMRL